MAYNSFVGDTCGCQYIGMSSDCRLFTVDNKYWDWTYLIEYGTPVYFTASRKTRIHSSLEEVPFLLLESELGNQLQTNQSTRRLMAQWMSQRRLLASWRQANNWNLRVSLRSRFLIFFFFFFFCSSSSSSSYSYSYFYSSDKRDPLSFKASAISVIKDSHWRLCWFFEC